MDQTAVINFKTALHEACRHVLSTRISALKDEIVQAQRAANEETKSSAGDKYETGRAITQHEIEKLTMQLANARLQEQQLAQINSLTIHTIIQPGSFVKTTVGDFFIAASLGEIHHAATSCMTISQAAPLGLKLKGRRAGDAIDMNNKRIQILEVI
ncbi:MAG TPA: 3-oxoacyl-ACP synthase [Ohtaekwangia sp.]|nr:3-oxoacyl-ACP synthase [Ohtaekwangia sp.]